MRQLRIDKRVRSVAAAVAILLAPLGAPGCGGSDEGTDTGGSAAAGGGTSGDCALLCDKAKACPNNTVADLCDPAFCGGFLERLRDDISASVVACATDATQLCESEWSACFVAAAPLATMRPIDGTFTEACLQKRMECSHADDHCLGSRLYDEAVVEQAEACLDESCAEVVDCLDAAFGN